MTNFFNYPSNQPRIGHVVRYMWKENPCVVVADRDNPRKIKYHDGPDGEPGTERVVPYGFDYTIVETGVSFSPYIDVKAGEVEAIIPASFIEACRLQLPPNPSLGDTQAFPVMCDDHELRLLVFQFVNDEWIADIAQW